MSAQDLYIAAHNILFSANRAIKEIDKIEKWDKEYLPDIYHDYDKELEQAREFLSEIASACTKTLECIDQQGGALKVDRETGMLNSKGL